MIELKRQLKNKIRYCVYGVLLFSVFSSLVVVAIFLNYKPVPLEVTLSGSSSELGRQYGESLKLPTKLVLKFYIDGVVCRGDRNLIESRRRKALALVDSLPNCYREELTAMGEACGIELAALLYSNAFLDLGNASVGCRSLVVLSGESILHSHNLDWENIAGLARWTTCMTRRNPNDGRLRTISVGFPGLIGAVDIINEAGVALSFNQLGFGNGVCTEPVFIMIRRIAETCHSFDDARTTILDSPPGMPFIITLSDAKGGKAAIFERKKERVTERFITNGWVAAANAAQGIETGRSSLDQVIMDAKLTSWSEVRHVLSHEDVMMDSNLYSVIFDYTNNRCYLASGQIPAAVGEYREYTMF